jgi:large conductance mechanosensitive channel
VKEMLQGFKKFLMQGDIVALAVAIVIGTAFVALVKALVADILTPIIALIFGKPDFSALSFSINSSHFLYGDFINNVIAFISVAAAVYFFVVIPVERTKAKRAQGADPDVKDCPECATEIPFAARRCPHCTVVLVTAA